MSFLTDPKILGPGIWLTIHLKAKRAIDEQGKRAFISEMFFHYNDFPCGNCREHIQEYMDSHPFEPFYNMKDSSGREIGLFKWSWMFHNAVNTRLHKPYLDWKTAYEMYQLDEDIIKPCTTCGSEKSTGQPIEQNTQEFHQGNNQGNNQGNKIDKNKIIQGYFLRKGIPETLNRSQSYDYQNF